MIIITNQYPVVVPPTKTKSSKDDKNKKEKNQKTFREILDTEIKKLYN